MACEIKIPQEIYLACTREKERERNKEGEKDHSFCISSLCHNTNLPHIFCLPCSIETERFKWTQIIHMHIHTHTYNHTHHVHKSINAHITSTLQIENKKIKKKRMSESTVPFV